MSAVVDRFAERYGEIFDRYLQQPGEAELQAAYELGREAVAAELSGLDLATAHHDALLRAVRGADAGGVEQVVQTASQFFLDILSAFEVAQSALREAREQVVLEKRQAVAVRRLSSFLADASLAVDAADSVEEALQLVAEHTREIVGAECCAVSVRSDIRDAVSHAHDESACAYLAAGGDLPRLYAAVAVHDEPVRLSSAELERHPAWRRPAFDGGAVRSWLAVPLMRLDGRQLGLIHLFAHPGERFSDVDEAVVVQLAQMAAAAIERAEAYRAGSAA